MKKQILRMGHCIAKTINFLASDTLILSEMASAAVMVLVGYAAAVIKSPDLILSDQQFFTLLI